MTAILACIPIGSFAADYRTQSFPSAHELFSPLQADPTEPHFGFMFGFPTAQRGVARVDVGDYLGIYRVALSRVAALQLNVGGAIFTRFDATAAHSLQVIDFYGNVPIDVQIGRVSFRSMFYHDSSHLGDDYLRARGIQSQDNSWEALREIVSVQAAPFLRLYGGYTFAVHTKPAWSGRQAVQGGTEITLQNNPNAFLHPYWATDVQSWERTAWNPTVVSQFGVRTGDRFSRGRGVSYFLQFKSGPRYEGQFYHDHETIWGFGLKFSLSDRLLSPAMETPAN